jgi:hypothetical protein
MQAEQRLRLFRDLWLEDPEQYFSGEELIRIQQLLRDIRDFEAGRDQESIAAQGVFGHTQKGKNLQILNRS